MERSVRRPAHSWPYYNEFEFVRALYQYYERNGFWPSLFELVFSVLVPACLAALLWAASSCIDYAALFAAPSGVRTPFSDYIGCHATPRYAPLIVVPLLAISALALCPFAVLQAYRVLVLIATARHVHHSLRLTDVELRAVTWSEIARRLLAHSPEVLAINPARRPWDPHMLSDGLFTERDLRVLLCKYDNYYATLLATGAVDMTTPWGLQWALGPRLHTALWDTLARALVMRWVVAPTLTSLRPPPPPPGADARYPPQRAGPGVGVVAMASGARFVFWIGVIAATPPVMAAIALVALAYAVARHLPSMRREPQLYGLRAWSVAASWRFRQYDELPHNLHQRLNRAFKPAAEYVAMFPSDAMGALAKFGAFAFGTTAGLLWVLSLWADGVTVAGVSIDKLSQNLFIGFLVSRALVPAEFVVFEPARPMRDMQAHLLMLPKEWISANPANDHATQIRHATIAPAFRELFELRAFAVVREVVSAVFAGVFLVRFALCMDTMQTHVLLATGAFYRRAYLNQTNVRVGFLAPEPAAVGALFERARATRVRCSEPWLRLVRACCMDPELAAQFAGGGANDDEQYVDMRRLEDAGDARDGESDDWPDALAPSRLTGLVDAALNPASRAQRLAVLRVKCRLAHGGSGEAKSSWVPRTRALDSADGAGVAGAADDAAFERSGDN